MDANEKNKFASFIREHRSNEANFTKLYSRLNEELNNSNGSYRETLAEIKEKAAEEYKKAKAISGTAWPEFEKFISDLEKVLTQ